MTKKNKAEQDYMCEKMEGYCGQLPVAKSHG